jgi:hypothetical protein
VPGENDERFVVAVVEVVRTLRLAGEELVEAEPEFADPESLVVRAPAIDLGICVVPVAGEHVHAASFGS